MVRISSQQVFNSGINRLQDLNSGLQKTQGQISTGKRVNNPSDDPVAAARILKLDQQVAQINQYQKNVSLADNRLKQEESALNSATDLIQRVRELTVQAGNGALSGQDRQSVAAELRQRLDQLAAITNTRDASGEYIFSGFKGASPAFVRNLSGDWVYQGDEGQRSLDIDEGVSVKISDSGKGLFVDVPTAEPSFSARANDSNTSGGRISTGAILDQSVFNAAYAANNDDLVVDIKDNGSGGLNYDVRYRSDDPAAPGYTAIASGVYTSGSSIKVAGLQFEISGAAAGDHYTLQTSRKQSTFTTIEKLIYGLETLGKTPAVANVPAASFSPQADDSLTINGVTFSGLTTTTALRDAINADTSDAFARISATTDAAGNLTITSGDADLAFSAADGGTTGGQIVVTGAKFQDLNLAGGVTSATVASGQQAFNDLIARSLNDLDSSQESILNVQTELGGRLNAVDSTRAFLEDSSVYSKDIRAQLRDVDYAKAVSQLSFQSFVLQAAQQSFAKVSQLSLFDRL